MPTLSVTSPDGRVFNVNGPEGSTKAQAIAHVQRLIADKTKLSNPKLPKAPPERDRGWLGTFRDINDRFVDTVTGGYGDEIAAAGAATRNVIDSVFGDAEYAPGKAFDAAQERFADRQEDFSARGGIAPAAATTAGIGGSIVFPEARVAKGAGALSRTANNAATGTAYGFAAGASQGDGFFERAGNAVEGAGTGLVMGLAADPLIRGGARVLSNAKKAILPYVSRQGGQRVARAQAQREVAQALETGQMTPAAASRDVERRSQMGVPASVSDISDQTRHLTGYASRGVGPGQAAVRGAIDARQARMAARTRQHIDETLGSTANPHGQSAALSDQARTASKPLYAEAYATPVTVTPRLREFMDSPVGPQAIESGANQVRMTPSSQRNIGSEQPFKDGPVWDPNLDSYRSGQAPVLETWDGAKRHLDDIEFDSNNPFTPRADGIGGDTRALDLRRRELIGELDAQVPKFAEARAAFAGPTQDKMAFRTGLEDLPGTARNTANDATAQMDRMSASQLDQFKLGDRTRLADEVYGNKSGVRRWGDATRPINGNDPRMDLIRTIHGDEAADRLFARTAAERDAHLTYRAVFGGSATAGRQTVDDAMAAAAGIQAIGQLSSGRPLAAAWTILTDAGQGRIGRFGEQLKDEIGQMMTSQNVTDVNEAMRLVEQRMQTDAQFAERLKQAASQIAKVTTIQAVGQSGDERGMHGPPNE